jgi:hypothetical protein
MLAIALATSGAVLMILLPARLTDEAADERRHAHRPMMPDAAPQEQA